MQLLFSPYLSPSSNLALEELLLRKTAGDFILLYVNEPCVVCGKHQNLLAEVDPIYCHDQGIPLYRRISGGGTVVHDDRNINFSFILNAEQGRQVDFEAYTRPVVAFLKSLGLDASYGGHHDIRVGGYKVSGNAEHVFKQRVLHHGTLLFDSDLDRLSACLRHKGMRFTGRGVASVPARVANIRDLLQEPMDRTAFSGALEDFLLDWFDAEPIAWSPANEAPVTELVGSKYGTREWNLGYSPAYVYEHEIDARGERLGILLEVDHGIIGKAAFRTGTQGPAEIAGLHGKWHVPDDLDTLYKASGLEAMLNKEEFRNLLF